jgi:hypothetical protein
MLEVEIADRGRQPRSAGPVAIQELEHRPVCTTPGRSHHTVEQTGHLGLAERLRETGRHTYTNEVARRVVTAQTFVGEESVEHPDGGELAGDARRRRSRASLTEVPLEVAADDGGDGSAVCDQPAHVGREVAPVCREGVARPARSLSIHDKNSSTSNGSSVPSVELVESGRHDSVRSFAEADHPVDEQKTDHGLRVADLTSDHHLHGIVEAQVHHVGVRLFRAVQLRSTARSSMRGRW